MSESTEKYKKMVVQNLDRIVVAVMWVLALGLVWVLFSEQSEDAVFIESRPPLDLPVTIDQNPNYGTYKALLEPKKLEELPALAALRTFNMFDHKSVKDREAIEREANQTYAQAEAAAAAGRTAEAVTLLRRTLEQFPTHQKAREMLQKLQPSGDGATTAPAAG